MLASATLCWAVALTLQPLRGRLDTESSARHPIRLSDLRTTITAVLAVRELRSLSFACFAFNGTQAVFVAYFAAWRVGLDDHVHQIVGDARCRASLAVL
jgi:hypothetical protein